MKRLPMPGVYADDEGGLHIDIVELLAGAGCADTPENRRILLEAVHAVFQGTPIHETDDPIES